MTYSASTGRIDALHDVSFEIRDHEFVCVVGPSGCGKTTLLKVLAGLVSPTQGAVRVRDDESRAPRTAMVFQDHGLFPWMTVLDNAGFGLEAQGVPAGRRRARSREMLARVGLERFAAAYPHQLSGGMQQRVGIARAMSVEPELLLMDEPFGSLDQQTKLVMQEDLLRVWQQERTQVVYVTHDLDEAVHLGDRVIVLTGQPGSVRAEIDVPIERPRRRSIETHHQAAEMRWQIWNVLEQEVRANLSWSE